MMKRYPLRYVGVAVGLIAGLLVIHYGIFKTAFLLLAAGLGWFAGKILDGEQDIWEFRRRRDEDEM